MRAKGKGGSYAVTMGEGGRERGGSRRRTRHKLDGEFEIGNVKLDEGADVRDQARVEHKVAGLDGVPLAPAQAGGDLRGRNCEVNPEKQQ